MEEFDEETLRAEIHRVWGAYGAHADLIDILIKKAHALDLAREKMEAWNNGEIPSCPKLAFRLRLLEITRGDI